MPVYDYRCKRCGGVHQELRKADDRFQPADCPKCGGPGLLVVSKPSRFRRGPGWGSRMDGASMPGEVD